MSAEELAQHGVEFLRGFNVRLVTQLRKSMQLRVWQQAGNQLRVRRWSDAVQVPHNHEGRRLYLWELRSIIYGGNGPHCFDEGFGGMRHQLATEFPDFLRMAVL